MHDFSISGLDDGWMMGIVSLIDEYGLNFGFTDGFLVGFDGMRMVL